MMQRSNLISLVRSMLDSGASVEEIVSTLKEMGIPEEDARKVIILANRSILLTLRNELREIARDVVSEEIEKVLPDIKKDIRDYVDMQMKMVNRNTMKYLREEVGKYVSELSKIEEKVDVVDRRLLDVEKHIFHRERSSISISSSRGMSVLMAVTGIVLVVAGVVAPLDVIAKIGLGVSGLVFLVGGVVVGRFG